MSRRRRRQDEEPVYVEVDTSRHVCLQFNRFEHEERYKTLRNRRFSHSYFLGYEPLVTLGVSTFIDISLPHQWTRLLSTEFPTYRELTLEFYSTFHFSGFTDDIHRPIMSFRMAGMFRELSLRDFAIAMGIYHEPEIEGLLGRLYSLSDIERGQLWQELTGRSNYSSTSAQKASHLSDPRLRVLHRIFAQGFFSRLESAGNVTLNDMLFLHSIHYQRFLCPALFLAIEFQTLSGRQQNAAICGGHFISRLAHGLNVLTPEFQATVSQVGQPRGLNLQVYRNMKVAVEEGGHWYLVGRDGQRWAHPETDEIEDLLHGLDSHPPSQPSSQPGGSFGSIPDFFGPTPSPPRSAFGPPPPPPDSDPYSAPRSWYEHVDTQLAGLSTRVDQLSLAHQSFRESYDARIIEEDNRWQQQQTFFADARARWTREDEMWARFTSPHGYPPQDPHQPGPSS